MREKDKTREQLLEELKELQQKHEILNTSYQQNIANRLRAEEVLRESEKSLKEKVRGLSLISEITSTFLKLESKDDIYNFLGEKPISFQGLITY